MATLASAPRYVAFLVFIYASVSLVLGGKYPRVFLGVALGALGWWGGLVLARLMFLPSVPSAALVAAMIPFLLWPLLDVLLGFLTVVSASLITMVVAKYFLPFAYQALLLGTSGALLAAVGVYRGLQLAGVLFYALISTVGIVSTLGAVLRAEEGSCFAPGAYVLCSGFYVCLATVWVVTGIWFQIRNMLLGDRENHEQPNDRTRTDAAPRHHHGRKRAVG